MLAIDQTRLHFLTRLRKTGIRRVKEVGLISKKEHKLFREIFQPRLNVWLFELLKIYTIKALYLEHNSRPVLFHTFRNIFAFLRYALTFLYI